MVPNTLDADRESALNRQVDGDHYKNFKIQPLEFSVMNELSFVQGCVIKYICRYKKKGTPLQDLEKIKHYIDILIELEGLNEYSCSDAGHPHSLTAGGVCGVDKD